MRIDYGVHIDDTCVRYHTSFASLSLTRRFCVTGRIQAFRKALKFVTWMFRDDPESLDEALSAIEYIIDEEEVTTQITEKHIDAVNNIRRKYGI